MTDSQQLDTSILNLPIDGRNVQGTLGDELGETPTLLVFLRHFGCIFCREAIKDLRDIRDRHPDYPSIMFFHQGTPQEGDHFFDRLWPQARAVPDIPKTFYDAFEVPRGGLREMFGPEVWACGVRAAAKGNTIGMKSGDPWTMPVFVLVQGDQVLWRYTGRHAGDHPDFERIQRLVKQTV
jgi:hypothetical protein